MNESNSNSNNHDDDINVEMNNHINSQDIGNCINDVEMENGHSISNGEFVRNCTVINKLF